MQSVRIGVVAAIGLALVAWLAWLDRSPVATAIAEDPVESFLASHWNHPLPPQGAPKGDPSPLEASLDATACAQCHPEQWGAWRGSLHSQAMGPGIQWQLRLMNQEQGNRCLRCHAPLAEQKALLALERGWAAAPERPRPEYIPADLHQQGVACAVCHVRGHERLGPPARPGKAETTAHNGFTPHRAFEDSRFCATCHQFPEDGPRVAGKLQEDTFAQWQASPFAGERSCQQCHMPDRQHLFRGIHDPEMVRKAVELRLDVSLEDGRGTARVSLHNVGAGHHFPTYMVPKVYLRLTLRGPRGETQELGEAVIGWDVDVGLTTERFDTRIPAGGQFTVERRFVPPQESGWQIEAGLRVAPREHYERVFADSLTKAARMDGETAALLRQAFEEAKGTRFDAMRVARPLDPLPAAQAAVAGGCERHAHC